MRFCVQNARSRDTLHPLLLYDLADIAKLTRGQFKHKTPQSGQLPRYSFSICRRKNILSESSVFEAVRR